MIDEENFFDRDKALKQLRQKRKNDELKE